MSQTAGKQSTTKSESPGSSGVTTTTPPSFEAGAELLPLDLAAGALLAQRVTKREDKRFKAARLLVTGRLRVLRVDREFIAAECRGDSGEVYNLLWKDQHWSCSCLARTDCSHLNALWAVVAVNRS